MSLMISLCEVMQELVIPRLKESLDIQLFQLKEILILANSVLKMSLTSQKHQETLSQFTVSLLKHFLLLSIIQNPLCRKITPLSVVEREATIFRFDHKSVLEQMVFVAESDLDTSTFTKERVSLGH